MNDISKRWHSFFPDSHFEYFPIRVGNLWMKTVFSTGRNGHSETTDPKTCSFEEDEQDRTFHDFDETIPDFYLRPNKYPAIEDHFILIAKEHISMQETPHQKRDLEQMLAFAKQSNMTLFHNSPKGGASIPQHEHYQAMHAAVPTRQADIEWCSENVGTMTRS